MNARCLILALMFVAPVAVLADGPSEPGDAGPGIRYKPGEVLVRFKSGYSEFDRAAVRAEMNGLLIRKFDRIRVEHIRLSGAEVEATIQRFSNHPLIEFVEPNYAMDAAAVPDDAFFPQLWNMQNTGQDGGTPLADIRIVPVWDDFSGDSTVKVGVMDHGVYYDHPDLINNIWTNPADPTINGVDDDDNGLTDDTHGFNFRDEYPPGPPAGNGVWDGNDGIPPTDDSPGHGTHVAGIIAGRGNNGIGVTGVCWKAEIVAIKVLNSFGQAFVDAAIRGLYYAQEVGCRVVNASFGSTQASSQAFRDAIEDVCGSGSGGMLLVVAAHNQGVNNDSIPMYPASFDLGRIISVAATDRDDELGYTDPSYASNYGPTSVDLAAPGWGVLSTILPTAYYGTKSGTSMATPHVTGAVTMIMGAHPSWSPDSVKALILAGIDTLSSLRGKVLTSGRLNAYKAFYGLTDGIVPAAVGNLTLEAGRTMVAVSWTNPGDDGSNGTAEAFDLRYSTASITSDNFYSATPVATSAPGSPGTPHCEFVGPLSTCQTYYFAVKTRDEAYNWSSLSNVVSGSTSCSGTWEPSCGIERPELRAEQVPGDGNVGEGGPTSVELTFAGGGGGDALPHAIRYGVPRERVGQALELAAFDLAGRRVRTLARGTAASGRFRVEWNLKSDEGHNLPSGLYLVRLRVGDVEVTRKLLHAQ